MPIYVYKFTETGETIEIQQSFTDEALTEAEHPVDGTMRPVKKVFTPIGITFKGGGFYKTDSSKGSSSSAAASSSSSSTSSSGESSASSAPAASTGSSSGSSAD